MTIVSVQSHVSHGYVGNSTAAFVLQSLGHTVSSVNTTLLAHHPGYGEFNGAIISAKTIRSIFRGLCRVGVHSECSALLSGYLGSTENGCALIDFWTKVKTTVSDPVYCCNTVMGDINEGVYVDYELLAFFRNYLLSQAMVVVANTFEAGILTGEIVSDIGSAQCAAEKILSKGPKMTIITSILLEEERGNKTIGNLYVDALGGWLVRNSMVKLNAKGLGDLVTALWLGKFLKTRDGVDALRFAISCVQELLDYNDVEDVRELPMVDTQKKWLSRPPSVPAERVR